MYPPYTSLFVYSYLFPTSTASSSPTSLFSFSLPIYLFGTPYPQIKVADLTLPLICARPKVTVQQQHHDTGTAGSNSFSHWILDPLNKVKVLPTSSLYSPLTKIYSLYSWRCLTVSLWLLFSSLAVSHQVSCARSYRNQFIYNNFSLTFMVTPLLC